MVRRFCDASGFEIGLAVSGGSAAGLALASAANRSCSANPFGDGRPADVLLMKTGSV